MTQRSEQWDEVREEHLRTNPRCAVCGGIKKLQVHHILPFHLFPEKELDLDNLITLCERSAYNCHFIFGHFHDWYSYNPDVIADAQRYLEKQRNAP